MNHSLDPNIFNNVQTSMSQFFVRRDTIGDSFDTFSPIVAVGVEGVRNLVSDEQVVNFRGHAFQHWQNQLSILKVKSSSLGSRIVRDLKVLASEKAGEQVFRSSVRDSGTHHLDNTFPGGCVKSIH